MQIAQVYNQIAAQELGSIPARAASEALFTTVPN